MSHRVTIQVEMTSLRESTMFNLVLRFLSLNAENEAEDILRFSYDVMSATVDVPKQDTDRSLVGFPNGSAGNDILETFFINGGQKII